MAVFRVERNKGYTVMSNHHLRNKDLTLKAKGLLSQMLSLPEDWDYTLAGLSHINRESIDAIRTAVWELEKAGYITRRQGHIEMDDVAVFPQCYAAVVDKIPTMAKKTLIVDIGSWTIDIMPVINKSPDESKCVTIPKGLITCMRSINEQCVRQLNGEVDESEIQNIMRYGRSDIDDEYFAIIKAEIEDFVDKVYNSIREFGYNLKTTPIVFVGGGAVVMKNFGSHDAKNISYNLDVKANARGYEQLATMGLKSTKRLS